MLAEIQIRDFAIVEELHIRFESGLNVLTGETGAGKSIVIDALGFVLGQRCGPSVVRAGARAARVEAVLGVAAALAEPLEALGVSLEDGQLILAREITAAGRNTCRANGTLVNQSVLREMGDLLIEIHGQHEGQGLLSAARHLEFLDRLGGDPVERLRVGLRASWERWRGLRAERDVLIGQQRDRERRREWLAFEVDEIDSARLIAEPDELEALHAERTVLLNADKIRLRVEEAVALIDEGDSGGARSLLGRVSRLVSQLSGLDPAASEMATAAEGVVVALDELSRELSGYAGGIEANPARLEQVQERLEQIARLQKKYGSTIAEILAFAERARRELGELEGSEARTVELEAEIAAAGAQVAELAGQLSQARRGVAASLEKRVGQELSELEMRGTQFAVRFTWDAVEDGLAVRGLEPSDGRFAVGSQGVDRVEFLISPNPGQPMMPLAQIASGGEASRIMLAIQSVLAEVDPVETLVFDEVDAGLGGVAAEAVAARLRKIAKRRQVLCITHLPLVAAAADTHWTLHKDVRDGQTRSRARLLVDEHRAREIARMLAGKQASETSLRQAEEMLARRKASSKKTRAGAGPASV